MKVLKLPYQAHLQRILLVHHLKKYHHQLLQVIAFPHRLPAALLRQVAQVVVPAHRLLNQAVQVVVHHLQLRIPTLLTLLWMIK